MTKQAATFHVGRACLPWSTAHAVTKHPGGHRHLNRNSRGRRRNTARDSQETSSDDDSSTGRAWELAVDWRAVAVERLASSLAARTEDSTRCATVRRCVSKVYPSQDLS